METHEPPSTGLLDTHEPRDRVMATPLRVRYARLYAAPSVPHRSQNPAQ